MFWKILIEKFWLGFFLVLSRKIVKKSSNFFVLFSGTKRKYGWCPSYIADPRKPRYPINQRWTNNRRLREVLPFEGVINFDSGIRKTSFRYNISILKTFFKRLPIMMMMMCKYRDLYKITYNSNLHETFGIMFWSCSKISSRVCIYYTICTSMY